MITISEVVEQIVKRSPLLEEGLYKKIINLSALARSIKSEVEKKLLKNVKDGAITMALKRLSKKLRRKILIKDIFKSPPDIILRSNLVEFAVSNSDPLIKKHKELLEQTTSQRKYFVTVTQGVFETSIIVSRELESKVEEIYKDEKIIFKLGDLSSISIKLPDENVFIPGVYYYILKPLAWEDINIIEVISTYTECTIILENKEVDRAFSILKRLLSK